MNALPAMFQRLKAVQGYAPLTERQTWAGRLPTTRRQAPASPRSLTAGAAAAVEPDPAAIRAKRHAELTAGFEKKGYANQFARAYADNQLAEEATAERRRAANQSA